MLKSCSPVRRCSAIATSLFRILLPLQTALLDAESGGINPLKLSNGKEIYEAACVACHGAEGKGMPQAIVGFDTPIPDFSDCSFAAREADPDWFAVVHSGGPARGFSEIMPAFSEALTSKQINQVIEYLRGFCRERGWPRGELNLPRALITEKAFPEDEVVMTTSVNANRAAGFSNRIVYEKRFGAGHQIEIVAPLRFQRQTSGTWFGGVGDAALGYKRLLFHSLRSGSVMSLSGEAVLPTGNRSRGLGNGVTVFEVFSAFGQILPSDSFAQLQGGIRLPTHTDDVARSAFWRTALGKSFFAEQGLGRAWTPMVEFLADRSFRAGARTNWDILPQVQVTLSRRQHVLFNIGLRVPATHTAGRSRQIVFYLLWDFYDGDFLDGW